MVEVLLLAVVVGTSGEVICDDTCGTQTICPTRMAMNGMWIECMIVLTTLNGD